MRTKYATHLQPCHQSGRPSSSWLQQTTPRHASAPRMSPSQSHHWPPLVVRRQIKVDITEVNIKKTFITAKDTWAGLTSGICAPLVPILKDDINVNKYNVHKKRRNRGEKVGMPDRQKQWSLSNSEQAGEHWSIGPLTIKWMLLGGWGVHVHIGEQKSIYRDRKMKKSLSSPERQRTAVNLIRWRAQAWVASALCCFNMILSRPLDTFVHTKLWR